MKYSQDELRSMANQVLQAKAANDFRYLQLVMQLSLQFRISPEQVLLQIKELAKEQ